MNGVVESGAHRAENPGNHAPSLKTQISNLFPTESPLLEKTWEENYRSLRKKDQMHITYAVLTKLERRDQSNGL